jgi:hypothetical protein
MNTFLFVLTVAALQGAFADDLPLPSVKGNILTLREPNPNTPFAFGSRIDGLRLGIWSEGTNYVLNHRINIWVKLQTEKPNPFEHSLMAGDPLFKDSFLWVTMPDGTLTKVGIGGPTDGSLGGGWSGGVSDQLHRIIRKPGDYRVQWKIGGLESGVVSFKVLPEP